MPDLAAIHVAGAGCGALDLDFWTDVRGFSFRFSVLPPPLRDLSADVSILGNVMRPVLMQMCNGVLLGCIVHV